MPTHRASLARLNLEQLSELSGLDRRTVKARLQDLAPVETTGREIRYEARAALSRIYCGRPVGGGGPRDLTQGLLRSMILPEHEWLPWRSPKLVPVADYLRGIGIEGERERAALHAIGFPIVAPAEGESGARTSPEHADRWLTLLSLVVETLGGDGAVTSNLGAELLRLEGSA